MPVSLSADSLKEFRADSRQVFHDKMIMIVHEVKCINASLTPQALNAYRIFCFFERNSVIILTHGFAKKTQKTPQKEIERAEAYRRDYLKRRLKK